MHSLPCYGFSLTTLKPLQINAWEATTPPVHLESQTIPKGFLRRLAHDAARDMIGRCYQTSCATVFIKHHPSGAPYAIVGGKHIALSISHLSTAIAVIFSHLPVSMGIDLSTVTKTYPSDLVERILTEAEHEWFFDWNNANIQRNFHFLWSLKEATMKAWGVGMQIAPWEINIQPSSGSFAANCLVNTDYPPVEASLRVLSSSLICAVAYVNDSPILHTNKQTIREHHLGC